MYEAAWIKDKTTTDHKTVWSRGVELFFIIALVLVLLRVLYGTDLEIKWLLMPLLLASVGLSPILRGIKISEFGFSRSKLPEGLYLGGLTSLLVLSVLAAAYWLGKKTNIVWPWQPSVSEQDLLKWSFYQLFYVAVAEEIFFRGFVLGTLIRICSSLSVWSRNYCGYLAILISSAIFAAAHVVVSGQIQSVVTFLPGLILGWLYYRSGALWAGILFHGLANITYGLISIYTI